MDKQFVGDLQETDLRGKRVLVRVDFNVPLKKSDSSDVSVPVDLTRVKATIPTIKFLSANGARVILCSHLGRPSGFDPSQSLRPLVAPLQQLISDWSSSTVNFVSDCVGPEVDRAKEQMQDGDILLLENLRFQKGETKNDPALSEQLGNSIDIYVNDAFGAAHRAHSSTAGVTKFVPVNCAGFLMKQELLFLNDALTNPCRPLVAIVGGAKVSTKLSAVKNLLPRVDALLIGGAMVYTFYRALGHSVGDSFVEEDFIPAAAEIISIAKELNVNLVLASDSHIVPTETMRATPVPGAEKRIELNELIPAGFSGVDIGPASIRAFCSAMELTHTVLWNGPLGMCEQEEYAHGTVALLHFLSGLTKQGTITILCGGDTVAALAHVQEQEQEQEQEQLVFSHVSMGGGAALEALEGKAMPGVAALDDKKA